jgi:signal transduction histidine kinase
MHDELVERNIETVEGDSIPPIARKHLRERQIRKFKSIRGDSTSEYLYHERQSARVEVFINGDKKDTVRNYLKEIAKKIEPNGPPQVFMIRLGTDSLQPDTLTKNFKEALARANLNVPFKVFSSEPGNDFHKSAKFRSEAVMLSPAKQYHVSFLDVENHLIKKITPEILFSAFLTLITMASFYVLFKSLRTQQKLMELKNAFISNITHELKTPVATVSVALEALNSFNALSDSKRTQEYLQIAQQELNRLTLMTDKILKTAVFESKGVELKIEKIDLDYLIREVISSLKLVLDKKKINLSYNKEGKDFTLQGGQAHLVNVLYNLIDNAIKYSNEHSNIAVFLSEKDAVLILSIEDKGIGIPREYHKKIFEKFFRVPSGDVHNTSGYGLGLSYVASVIKSHGGAIHVESEEGKGSNFIITLPKLHEN